MNIPDDLTRIIKVDITLNPDRRDAELAAIRALPRAFPFLGEKGLISLRIPSLLEAPYPMEHELIEQAVDMIHASRMELIYGRKVFSTWQGGIVQGRSEANDVYHAATHAIAINQVVQEAHALGAVATSLCYEPNGDHPAVETWKRNGFDGVQRGRVIAAIIAAREQLGFGVDYCHPAGGSWNPMHFGWATRYVADPQGRITHQTYTLDDPEKFKPVPPKSSGMTADKRWWSSHIGHDPATAPGTTRPLSIQAFRSMDWEKIREAWPDLQGVVLYGGDHLAWLLAELGKGE